MLVRIIFAGQGDDGTGRSITIFAEGLYFLKNIFGFMGDTDLEILKISKKDGRTKHVKIVESFGLTEGAVRRRIKKSHPD